MFTKSLGWGFFFLLSSGLVSSWGSSTGSTASARTSGCIITISSNSSGLALVVVVLELTFFVFPE